MSERLKARDGSGGVSRFAVRRRTMASDVFDVLRERIVLGDLPAGGALRLEQLAQSLGVSISPVREAIRQLGAIGLVEHLPYKGARVTTLSIDDMRDVYEGRVALECLSVRKVAERFDDHADSTLRQALDGLSAAYERGDRAQIVYGNTAFHLAIAQLSGSRTLSLALLPTLEASQRYSAAAITSDDPHPTYDVEARDHAAIVDACRSGDADSAEALMREHLTGFAELIAHRLAASHRATWTPA